MQDFGYAGPSVADGKLFIIDRYKDKYDRVRAINIKTGKDVWTFTYLNTGRARDGYARATPCYSDGLLYTISHKCQLYCLNASNGKKNWGYNIIDKLEGDIGNMHMSLAPVIDGNRLLVCPGGKHNVVVLNKKTGQVLLKGGNSEGISYAKPVVAEINGEKQYIFFTPCSLIGISPEDGRVIWRYRWESKQGTNIAQPLIIGKNKIFITTGYKKGSALIEINKNTVTQLWLSKDMQGFFNSPVLHEGFIYGSSDPDYLVCLDLKTGKAKWKQKGFGNGGLLFVDGMLIALNGRRGDLVMVKASPDFYKELGKIKPLSGRSWSPPIFSDKKIYIRNRLYLTCVDIE